MSFAHLKVRRKFFTGLFAFSQTFPSSLPSIKQNAAERTVACVKRISFNKLPHHRTGTFLPVGLQLLEKRKKLWTRYKPLSAELGSNRIACGSQRLCEPGFYRILIHVCTDMLRQRKRVTFVPPDALDAGSYEDPLPLDGDLATRVDALPPEIATIIRLRFYEELSLKEISAATGAPLSTVKHGCTPD